MATIPINVNFLLKGWFANILGISRKTSTTKSDLNRLGIYYIIARIVSGK